jgi:hypothetical protein
MLIVGMLSVCSSSIVHFKPLTCQPATAWQLQWQHDITDRFYAYEHVMMPTYRYWFHGPVTTDNAAIPQPTRPYGFVRIDALPGH